MPFAIIALRFSAAMEGCRTWVSDKTLLKLADALKVDIFQLLAPVFDENDENAGLFLPQRVVRLRQTMKDDIDKRLDQFFAEDGAGALE